MLHWNVEASWLAGIALSTTSVAVVYAVMLEFGLNKTDYGKTVLAACFVNDLATVVALGLMFSPFTYRTLVFIAASVVAFAILPWLTPRFFRRFGNRPPNSKRSSCSCACSAWARLRPGRTARPCCRRT